MLYFHFNKTERFQGRKGDFIVLSENKPDMVELCCQIPPRLPKIVLLFHRYWNASLIQQFLKEFSEQIKQIQNKTNFGEVCLARRKEKNGTEIENKI